MTVFVADPGTKVVYYESPAELARYANPTATGRNATRWNPATDATIEVSYATNSPTWQQLRLQVIGPDGAVVPVHTYRSTARYDVDPGRLGRAVATFDATTAGSYRVSAARATEAGGRLAVGDNFPGPSPRPPWARGLAWPGHSARDRADHCCHLPGPFPNHRVIATPPVAPSMTGRAPRRPVGRP